MFAKKTSIFLALLFSINTCINGYDVTSFFPFGKAAHAITAAIKQLTAKKVTLGNALNDHFTKQEKEIINKIKIKYGIADYIWQSQEQLFDSIIAKDPLFKPLTGKLIQSSADHPIIRKARELLVLYSMNPTAVSIINSSDFETAGVISSLSFNNIPTHTLHLNIPELAALSQAEYTAILKHEIMHLWYGDNIKTLLLYQVIPWHPDLDFEPLLNDYSKNYELRADIMAALHDTKDAQALSLWLSKYISLDPYSADTHPKFSERVQALKQLLAYQQEEMKYKIT